MKQLLRKRCLFCNKAYLTKEADKDFCTDLCKAKKSVVGEKRHQFYSEKQEEKFKGWKCINCGLVFGYRDRSNRSQFFCEPKCGYEYNFNKQQQNCTNICRVCKTKFISSTSTTYCSHACLISFEKKRSAQDTIKKIEAREGKEKKKRHAIPYEVLNKIAEKRRLEEEWKRLTR